LIRYEGNKLQSLQRCASLNYRSECRKIMIEGNGGREFQDEKKVAI
jgi:hypothetical protein